MNDFSILQGFLTKKPCACGGHRKIINDAFSTGPAQYKFCCESCGKVGIIGYDNPAKTKISVAEQEALYSLEPMPDYPAGTIYWPDKKPEQSCLESDEIAAIMPVDVTNVEVKCYEGPITCPKCGIPFYEEDRSNHPSNFVNCPRCQAFLRKRYSHVIISEKELAYLLAVQVRWQEIVNSLPTDRELAWKMFNGNAELLKQKVQFQRLRIRVKPRFVEAPIPPQESK